MNTPAAVRGVRAAFVFLTRLPLGGFPYTDDDWRWAAAHFPLVGAVVGLLAACVDRLLSPLGDFAAALAALAASMLLTGAFHEDGLADTSDALGGAFDRDRIMAILKDSRIGTFGACALAISILGRAALIARLGRDAMWSLPLVGMASRVGPVWQLAALPYVTSAASRSGSVAGAGTAQACVATVWMIAIGGAVAALRQVPTARVVVAAVAMTVVTLLAGWRYMARLGGITGDFLGATEQLCELVGYASLAWGIA